MHIGERMKELIPLLRAGVNDVRMPDVRPECEGEWGPDYAIVRDVYHERDDDYFDADAFWADVRELVLNHFRAGGGNVVGDTDPARRKEKRPAGSVVVNFYGQSQEIEVYRA